MRRISTGVQGRPILGRFFTLDNTINSITTNADLILAPDGTGRVTTQSQVSFTNTAGSTNKDTGSLVVDGGVGVEENINLGGNIADGNGFSTGTQFLTFPSGDISDRPSSPSTGFTRFNTDYNLLEVYNGTKWVINGFKEVDVNSDRTTLINETNWVDTSSNPVTITLPESPSKGDEIRFFDVSSTFDINALTLSSSSNIMGVSDDLIVNTVNAAFLLVYYNASSGWRIFSV